MPRMAVMMFIGMAGMFLAPFGMLISKWAAIEAFVQAPFGLIFIAILAYGSAVTVFFWAKWMGKLVAVTREQERVEKGILEEPWAPLYILTGLVVAATLLFPLISSVLIEPYVLAIYGATARMAQANVAIAPDDGPASAADPFLLFKRSAKPPRLHGRETGDGYRRFAGSLVSPGRPRPGTTT